jgi:hypothetical protein
LSYAEMTQQWPPGSDPEEAHLTLTTLLPWDTVQGLSEMPDQERVWDSCCEQREEKQITEITWVMRWLHESPQGCVKLKRLSVTIRKHEQFSLWTLLQVSQVHRQELIVSCTVKLCGDLLKSTPAVCGIGRAHSCFCVFLWRTPALRVRSMCRTHEAQVPALRCANSQAQDIPRHTSP